MTRRNYYKKKLVDVNDLKVMLDNLDPEKPEMDTILDINRAAEYALTQPLTDTVKQEYRDVHLELHCIVNEWIDSAREEIRRQYDMNDYQDIEAFDEWAAFIRQLPDDMLTGYPDEYIEALAGQIHLGSDYKPQYEDDYGEEADA